MSDTAHPKISSNAGSRQPGSATHLPGDRISALLGQLESIRSLAEKLEVQFASELAQVHPEFHHGARNLIHYMALRHVDIRDLQTQLSQLGLSSLGRAEQHVMASVSAVQQALGRFRRTEDSDVEAAVQEFGQSAYRLETHTKDLLGANSEGREVVIMVTLPSEAADNYQLVQGLVDTGMDIARINCAHDTRVEWLCMIENIRRASEESGKVCKIVMDLAGPKLRTGDLLPGPGVVRIRPRRDVLGRVVSPNRVRFVAADALKPGKKLPVLPVPRQCIDYAAAGDEIRFKDTRGRKRKLHVTGKQEDGLILESYKRAYVATGTKLRLIRKASGEKISFRVGELPSMEQPILLKIGDSLILQKANIPGEPARVDADGSVLKPAHVSCRLPEIFRDVSVGAPVRLNDGKIEGIVQSAADDELVIQITRANDLGSRLRSNRSINFPGSDLKHRGLTEADRDNLEFVVEHADAVGLSFVREPADVIALQQALSEYPDRRLGIIPKIETKQGFKELPRILLAAMRTYPAGVMIARGDLAVECGWERLAEIQEEILWLCEAAQLPAIWATQVLEGEAKKGRPTRAEITDAAMSQRADCVMLNKGPHILAAIRMLDNILRRMQNHQHKKTAKLRKLSITEL